MQRRAGGSRADAGVPHLGAFGPAINPQLRPSRGPGTHAPHPRIDRRPGRRPARTRALTAQLYADRRRRSRPGTGQRPHAADLPRRGDGTLPGPGPGFLHRCRPGHRLLRLQRARPARGPPPAGRSRRRGHHHRRPGALGPAPRLRLGTRRRAGRLPGRRRGQRRGRLGRRTRRAQRRREGPAAAVPAHRGDRRRRASPPGELPHGGGRRRLVLLPARRRAGPHLAVGTRTERPRGRAAAPGRHRSADRPAQHPHHARHPRRPHRLDGAADGSGRRCSGGGVRRRGPRILLARRPGRLRLPDVLRHRRTRRGPHPRRPGRPGSGRAGAGPASRTAEALAATRWSIRR